MEIATQNKTSLYREEGPVVVRAWSWSPDGRHLLLQRPPESLVIVNPNGNTRIDLGIGEFPAWSFDGSKIAYTYLEQDSEKFLAGDIYMVNVDGIEKTRLTHMAQQIAFKPVWSPNGKQIIFLAEKTRFVYIGTLP
jgi:Tol biopolymer transport system component